MKSREKSIRLSTVVAMVLFSGVVGFICGTRKNEILGLIAPVFGLKNDTVELDLSSVQNTFRVLSSKFDGDINKDKIIEGASKGLVESLGDPHTVYMDSEEADEFNKNLTGDVGAGIGVQLGKRNKLPTVIRTLKGNPAISAGIKSGDIIFEVNGERVDGMTIEQITSKIKGDVGTSVKIKIIRDGEQKDFSIVRAKIANPSVEVDYSGDIAILTVSRFDGETGSLAKKYAQEIKQKGVSKIILDLRGNGGGYVTAAQDVASLWLNKKDLIVTEKTGEKIVDEVRATGDNILSNVKTIVLADENSASASEIVVGALKDRKIAKIYGVKTYGKGSVQEPIKLNNGAVLKVTVAKWYTPSGKNIDKEGISPDKRIENSNEQLDRGEDYQLDVAKQDLR